MPILARDHNLKKDRAEVTTPTSTHATGATSTNHDLSAPRILLYSHDTFGLGNIRRTLLLSQALTEEFPNASILIVTGSPVIHAFRIPDRIDYIKLPSLDRVDSDSYEPRFLHEWAA